MGGVSLSPKGPSQTMKSGCTVVELFIGTKDTRFGEKVQTRACCRRRVDPCLVLLPPSRFHTRGTRSPRSALQPLMNYPGCLVDKKYSSLLLFLGADVRHALLVTSSLRRPPGPRGIGLPLAWTHGKMWGKKSRPPCEKWKHPSR